MYKSARFFIMTPLPHIKELANYLSVQGMGELVGWDLYNGLPPLGPFSYLNILYKYIFCINMKKQYFQNISKMVESDAASCPL